uniref:Uncharacterized protein n=1 Tax=Anopheles maculatus TaxID=74869 RepID=A0A182SZG9_9DIPT
MSSKHCRICYKLDQDDLISVRLMQDGISIEEMVLAITSISVSDDRRLPQNICLECLDRLREAFKLRQQCISTHDRLCAELESTHGVIVAEQSEQIKPEPDDVTSDDASIVIEKIEIDAYGEEDALDQESEQSDSRHADEEHYEAIEIINLACCGCAMRFSTRDELEEHATLHHRNGRMHPQSDTFHCTICNQSFPDQVMHDRHQEAINQNHQETIAAEEDEITDEDEQEYEVTESDRDGDWEEQTTQSKSAELLQKASVQSALCRIEEKNLLVISEEQQGYMIVELQSFRCCCCAELFATEQDLNKHLEKKRHSNNDTSDTSVSEMKYTCEHCGKRFAYWLVYVCHQRVRNQRQFYMCGLCNTLLDSKKRMISHMHMSDEHADYFKLSRACVADRYEAIKLSGVRCCCCKQYFDEEADRIEHLARMHGVSKAAVTNLPNSCTLCGRQFRSKRHLEIHLQYIQDVTQYYCKLCDFQTYNPRRMELHLHSGIHRDELSTTVQLKPLQNNLLKSSCLQYCCFEDCHKHFPDGPALKQHIHEAHEPALTTNRNQTKKLSQLLQSGSYHACNDCGVLFKNLSAFQAHRARRRSRQGLLCAVCGVSKTSRALLRIHERSHSGERPYRCKDCDKTFISNQTLLSHRRCHVTGTHKCDTCGN